ECAVGITEKLTGDKIPWDGGAIDGYVRTIPPAAAIMNRLGKDIFSGPAFPGEENVGINLGGYLSQSYCFEKFRIASNYVFKVQMRICSHHPSRESPCPLDLIKNDEFTSHLIHGQDWAARQREICLG